MRMPCAGLAVVLVFGVYGAPANAQVHAICPQCGDWYQISANGAGLDREHCALCGKCCNPDNFQDGQRDNANDTRDSDAAQSISDALDFLNAGSTETGGGSGSNVPRHSNANQIANDLADLLDYLNTGQKSEDLQGNNSGRYQRTK